MNTATVKGLAERMVPADLATWSIGLSGGVRSAAKPDLDKLYKRVEDQQAAVLAVLKTAGFKDDEIAWAPFSYRTEENRNSDYEYIDTSHFVTGRVMVTSSDLAKVEKAHFAMADLPRKGMSIRVGSPEYRFTGLNGLKPDMLREATKNARIAADEFARDAGVSVGGIQSARQGGFSIRDAGSAHSETQELEKMVRVVTTITFYLEN